jgi:hypothetical protein
MTKLDQPHKELVLSLTRSLQQLDTQEFEAIALSNPSLVQEWIDELLEEHEELQIQAARLEKQIDRLQSSQNASLMKAA